ncbi:hypothetical protein [Limoniibacter endophyticus]|uniref:DUF1254 domain-containing protein n=1 Tax=Limoniibacter endophyticus TaxID=1565040 RepID=A0A8J3DGL5_9HYPH|nr:hypothetical protein [Limoniibacter endophyticus]GHC69417.1 DUF1254 domain-containing protein [Limoniibacter endophyticus]
MSLLRSTAYGLFAGLVGAGILHAGAILLAPTLAIRYELSPFPIPAPGEVARLGTDGENGVFEPHSPVVLAAACGFSLEDDAVTLSAHGTVPYWAVTTYDAEGHVTYSFNDRVATESAFEVAVGTQPQRDGFARARVEDEADGGTLDQRAPVIAIAQTTRFAVLRVYVPDASWTENANSMLESLNCSPLPVPTSEAAPQD